MTIHLLVDTRHVAHCKLGEVKDKYRSTTTTKKVDSQQKKVQSLHVSRITMKMRLGRSMASFMLKKGGSDCDNLKCR